MGNNESAAGNFPQRDFSGVRTNLPRVQDQYAEIPDVQIYRGEPFGEAPHDIVLSEAIAVSHPLSQASSMERTDVFATPS
jgi:hypothetical protein